MSGGVAGERRCSVMLTVVPYADRQMVCSHRDFVEFRGLQCVHEFEVLVFGRIAAVRKSFESSQRACSPACALEREIPERKPSCAIEC